MVIECKAVDNFSDPLLDKVEKTYTGSFPEAERRAFSLVRDLVKDDPRFIVYALFKDRAYAGFITAWRFGSYTYVKHFAIDESARNGGIGAEAMKQFLALHETPVVLEVEIPTEEMSKRRIGFYERLGYVLDDHVYYQPPYREGESFLEMRLMTYGDIDLDQLFEEVRDNIHRHVYGVKSKERIISNKKGRTQCSAFFYYS